MLATRTFATVGQESWRRRAARPECGGSTGGSTMTQLGYCHNATFREARITPALAQALGIQWVRTIVYDPTNPGVPQHSESWNDVIASAAELKGVGVETLVVFNSESYGGAVENVDQMASRLNDFLTQANGAVRAIEPGNELDDPKFNVSDDLIIRIGRAAAAVCKQHNVICLSPSLLTGPEEGHFETVANGLAGHINARAVHPY